VKLRLLLANYAEIQNQVLYLSGVGWTEIGPGPSGFAIAAVIDVPWDETNRRHRCEVTIVDADGHAFMVPTPEGLQPLVVQAEFEVGRPPGATAGRWFTVPIAANIAQIDFPPNVSYIARATLNGEFQDEVHFVSRPRR
jgi:hypothetical protein